MRFADVLEAVAAHVFVLPGESAFRDIADLQPAHIEKVMDTLTTKKVNYKELNQCVNDCKRSKWIAWNLMAGDIDDDRVHRTRGL